MALTLNLIGSDRSTSGGSTTDVESDVDHEEAATQEDIELLMNKKTGPDHSMKNNTKKEKGYQYEKSNKSCCCVSMLGKKETREK